MYDTVRYISIMMDDGIMCIIGTYYTKDYIITYTQTVAHLPESPTTMTLTLSIAAIAILFGNI